MASSKLRHNASWNSPPTTMFASLLVAFLLALGHHLFYSHLAGRSSPGGSYDILGTTLSKQRFNTALGTAFAFMVKAFLTLAVAVAYAQQFWRCAKTATSKTRVSTLDTLFSSLHDFTSLFKMHIWFRYPLLFALTLIAWLLPLASIITPATLSVKASEALTTTMAKVPQFDFVSLNFNAGLTYSGNYSYMGPGNLVQRIATAVSVSGEISSIQAPALNSSWELDFYGPSLECNHVTGQERTDIWNNTFNYLNGYPNCYNSYGYISWAQSSYGQGPFLESAGLNTTLLDEALGFGIPGAVYIAAIPALFAHEVDMATHTLTSACAMTTVYRGWTSITNSTDDLPSPESAYFSDATLMKCELHNASYHAEFSYVDGVQKVDVTKGIRPDNSSIIPIEEVYGPQLDDWSQNSTCLTLNTNGTRCFFDPVVVGTLSYQSIAAAFNKLILGTITQVVKVPVSTLEIDSNIGTSVLLNTDELAFISEWHRDGSTESVRPSLQGIVQNGSFAGEFSGLASEGSTGFASQVRTGSRGPLGPAMETLFQNLTISLLSEQFLQPNYSSPFAPPAEVEVTFRPWDNVYVYATTTLWIAYGLAIFFTVVSIGLGLLSIARNGTGFNNDFSTIVRVGRTTTFSEKGNAHDPDAIGDDYPMVGRKSLSGVETAYKPAHARSLTQETIVDSGRSIRSSRASFDNGRERPLSDSRSRRRSPR